MVCRGSVLFSEALHCLQQTLHRLQGLQKALYCLQRLYIVCSRLCICCMACRRLCIARRWSCIYCIAYRRLCSDTDDAEAMQQSRASSASYAESSASYEEPSASDVESLQAMQSLCKLCSKAASICQSCSVFCEQCRAFCKLCRRCRCKCSRCRDKCRDRRNRETSQNYTKFYAILCKLYSKAASICKSLLQALQNADSIASNTKRKSAARSLCFAAKFAEGSALLAEKIASLESFAGDSASFAEDVA